uniref:Receptor-like serine/threonine-protein kinase n=1 Tax=Ananas comosus var. bracteatus TaxID=296719 RepID=A0A6V7QD86_ANACO|nr:unnamed protein product [Ananas comosus var. bracteatus]
MLGSDGASLPTPKQPGFARRRIQLDTESSSSKQDSITRQPARRERDARLCGRLLRPRLLQPPNNPDRYVGIWFNNIPTQTVVWVANRLDPVAAAASPSFLSLSPDGILTLASPNSSTPLSTTATTLTNPVAQLLDTGNFVVREATDAGDAAAWQSFDYPTDTMIAGMKLGVDRRRGLNWTLTSWRSGSDPAPGEYYVAMETAGDPELFLYSVAGRARIWRSGQWDGVQFSGLPDNVPYGDYVYTFTNNAAEVSYSFNVLNRSLITRGVVNQTGVAQQSMWVQSRQVWNIIWHAPQDPCDEMSPCGPYGLCDPTVSPMCSCVQGFEPRSPQHWALLDGSDGCVRTTRLDCANRTDGFAKVSHVNLPDPTNCTVDATVGLDQCATRSSNASSGARSGCVMWYSDLTGMRVFLAEGQDLYVRLAAADLGMSTASVTSHSGKSDHAPIAAIVSVSVLAFLLACAGWYIWRMRKLRKSGPGTSASTISFSHKHRKEESTQDSDIELPLFDLSAIAVATEEFSNTNKLGEGGFGPVYKGKLGNGQEIAVKTLAKTSAQGPNEFKNEVMLIAKLQHRNLVRLLGCCIQGEERMLIYEYMENKSLDRFLFDKAYSASLNWQTRYRIIEGIARGLVYLHQDSRFRVIHRDLKAGNILLDKEMNPKISDFGMARIFGGDETEVNTRKVVGTYGYMSPEYAMDGIFSVWSLWTEGKSLELVDESMDYSFLANEVLKCLQIGLLCVQEHPEDRPLMSAVVLMLGSDGASLRTPKQPGFARRRVPIEMEFSSSKHDSRTLNDVTITMIGGR